MSNPRTVQGPRIFFIENAHEVEGHRRSFGTNLSSLSPMVARVGSATEASGRELNFRSGNRNQ